MGDAVMDAVQVSSSQTVISILKSRDSQGHPAVAVVLSQNAFVEMSDTHEPYPGVSLNLGAALLVAEKIVATVREIATAEPRKADSCDAP
jgi:hypothetical protein